MPYRPLAAVALAAGLSACASGPLVLPVQATRYHYDPVVERGTVAVLAGGGPGASADSPEFQVYADAVRTALTRAGYSVVPEGSRPQNLATVDYRRGLQPLWEGTAHSVTDAGAPGADAGSIAARLADALFRDFPGESGRTIQVK